MKKRTQEPAADVKALLQRLADNLEIEGDGGWDEDEDDRKVVVGRGSLKVKTTFGHFSGDGGKQRFTTTFKIDGDKLVDDNDGECLLADEVTLQAFVNDCCSYHNG